MEQLSDNAYKELCKYRHASCRKTDTVDLQSYFADAGYIEADETETIMTTDDDFEIITISYKLTDKGRTALEANDKMRKQESSQAAKEKFHYIFEIALMLLGFVLGILSSYVAHCFNW